MLLLTHNLGHCSYPAFPVIPTPQGLYPSLKDTPTYLNQHTAKPPVSHDRFPFFIFVPLLQFPTRPHSDPLTDSCLSSYSHTPKLPHLSFGSLSKFLSLINSEYHQNKHLYSIRVGTPGFRGIGFELVNIIR